MSQQEFEQNDQEVMNLVNGAASPEAKAVADKIESNINRRSTYEAYGESVRNANPVSLSDDEALMEVKAMHKRYRRPKLICGGICVAACVLMAVMLVILLENPAILSWFVYVAILICGIVAGFHIEKLLRLMR